MNPLLLTLGFDDPTDQRLNAWRTQYFPRSRNQVPAHLSLFHQLPANEKETIGRVLREVSKDLPFNVDFSSVRRTEKGFHLVVVSPPLLQVRAALFKKFYPWLNAQDRAPFKPHVTLMNKADRLEVLLGLKDIHSRFTPWTCHANRFLLWEYRGGPWELMDQVGPTF